MKKTFRLALLAGVSVCLLSACGTHTPKPDLETRQERIDTFRKNLTQEQKVEPLTGNLTLSNAIARAIKYNLDHKVKQMETAVAQQHLNLARLSYLPDVTAMAGYSSRNNDAGAYSRSLTTNEISLESSTSQERDHTLTSLRAAWDVVDFGLTYYTVNQKTDEIAITGEQRRKVVQNIIQDVQEAYWRAYIAQELSKNVDRIITESGTALEQFKRLASSGQINPQQGLNQQRDILLIRYNMRTLQEQLAQGRIHLIALLNLPPGSQFTLEPIGQQEIPALGADIGALEQMALTHRPELRMEDSKVKINEAEIKKSMLKMFPRLQFWGQLNHDSNEYLYNNDWSEAGVQLTWKLLESADGLGKKGVYDAEGRLAEARHMALSMAVISQVHLALNRYEVARAKYLDAADLAKVSDKLAGMIKRDTQREGAQGFNTIRANLQATSASMEGMLAYAELQNALMRLYNTLGLDPIGSYDVTDPVAVIAGKVDGHFHQVNDTLFKK